MSARFFGARQNKKMRTSEDISQISTVLIAIGGVEIDNSSEGSGDWGLSLSLCCSTLGTTTAIVMRMLKGLVEEKNRSG